ncbi:hypothetical protein [Mycobacterium kubicae]|uniref:Glycosyltransferase RgtA/B/C/D-like domain-containing protein n=1 Tax=Mycobacterium kubicae TaxID=120959 RepID=A0AAX1JHL3_9MYCO|nr:hypothetical protein [Mycobacterium kubicae]MCV7095509.1 hypothetical protein [Mycobacterium kubicae]ORV94156.1 hypothetical protein AWC13_23235 [Mycobacterium kubicae]QNI11775.1 hypothetical protein GAN18_11600 [Mycobacterium kubicae]QPI39997.1 hypothetical protein I2456_11455 [Mycobacterium kubicae]
MTTNWVKRRVGTPPAEGSPDHDEPSPTSTADRSDPPPRRSRTVAVLAAVACVVLGAKLIVISLLGSPMPLADQWDGEAAGLYAPYLKGTLTFGDLFAPHNEHRIFVFRLFALTHLELAGEWNPRLEMVLGAIIHTAAITWFLALLMPLVAARRRLLLACFVTFFFAIPFGYENTLSGFQCQLYFSLLFGIAALVALASARPFSVRWTCGVAAAILSYFSFATGVATILAAGALVGLQLLSSIRKRSGRELAGVAALALVACAMIFWSASRAHPTSTPWTFLQGLALLAARTVIALIPIAWYWRHTLARRAAASDRAWVAIGISGWVVIQLVLLAYGRGNDIAVRYMDIVLLVYPLAVVAVLLLVDNTDGATRFGRYAAPGAAAGVFLVVAMFGVMGYIFGVGATQWSDSAREQLTNAQAYLATKNLDQLKSRRKPGQTIDVAYPNSQRLAAVLGDPDVRAILPGELRPADADLAGARNHMWLKGSSAAATAAVVNLLLFVGPAFLAVGVALFFAVATRLALADRVPKR